MSKLVALTPWYRGFLGQIKVKPAKTGKKAKPLLPEPEEPLAEPEGQLLGQVEEAPQVGKLSMMVTGRLTYLGGQEWLVDEIPLGWSIMAYRDFLDVLVEERKIFDYRANLGSDEPYFLITSNLGQTLDLKSLRLIRSFGLGNQILLDLQNRPIRYDRVDDILETFYQTRLPYYQKRKDYQLKELTDSRQKLTAKLAFLRDVNTGKIEVGNKHQTSVLQQMEQLGHDPKLLFKITLNRLSQEEIVKLEQQITEKDQLIAQLSQISPQELWLSDLRDFLQHYQREGPRYLYQRQA